MRIQERSTPRPVASLHLAYNQCIIQTTRPVLLHLFKMQFQLGSKSRDDAEQPLPPRQRISPITLALAESCMNAAQASSRIVEGLFLDGSIATFGFWDAHHIFSAAMMLVMSAVMRPTPVNSDPLETLLSVLRALKSDGNIPAVDFCERLSHIQACVSKLRATGQFDPSGFGGSRRPSVVGSNDSLDASAGGQSYQPDVSTHTGGAGDGGVAINQHSVDALGNPLTGNFSDGSQVQWLDVLFSQDGTLNEFAREIEGQHLFES